MKTKFLKLVKLQFQDIDFFHQRNISTISFYSIIGNRSHFDIEIQRCHNNVKETNKYQSQNDVDVGSYKQPYSLHR